jgi:hypothetical protein
VLFGVEKNLLVRVLERLGVFFVFWGSICAKQPITLGKARFVGEIRFFYLCECFVGIGHTIHVTGFGEVQSGIESFNRVLFRVRCDMPNSMHEVAMAMGSSGEGGVAEQRGCSDNSG